jgi:hypothetical protein
VLKLQLPLYFQFWIVDSATNGYAGTALCSLGAEYEWITAQILSVNGKRDEVDREILVYGLCEYFSLIESV